MTIRREPLRSVALSALTGVAFYLTALLGLHMGLSGTSVSPVWPASGVALGAVLLCGRRVLVGIWLAGLLVQLSVHTPLAVSALQGVGDALEAWIAAQALFLLCGRRCRLAHLSEALVLLVFGAGAGAGIGATVGVASLVAGAGLPAETVWTSWFTWWLGDASGLILVTPLIVYLAQRPWERLAAQRLAEGVLFLALVAATGFVAFWGVVPTRVAAPLQYLTFVMLVVVAFRFGARLTAAATNLLVAVAVAAAILGRGPFILGSTNDSLLHVQGSMISLGVAGLLLAIVVHQRRLALGEVETARDRLEETVRARTAELNESLTRLEALNEQVIAVIAGIVDARDPYTAGHQRRVGALAAAIAAELGLDAATISGVRVAGLVHDVGKVTVPVSILNKPGRLSEVEFELIKGHAEAGYEILRAVEFPWPVAETIRQHHERLNGRGYPRGLRDGEIILEARILAVADVVEAMASHRPYRPALGLLTALAEVENGKGDLYDAAVAAACARLFREKDYDFDAPARAH